MAKIQRAKPCIGNEEIEAAIKVLKSGRFVKGPEAEALGKEFAQYCGAKFGVAVNSGTSALELALAAIGIKPGDEVITATNSFMATANAIVNSGAIPVFADVDETYTLDMCSLESLITPKTKAIIPVHLYGHAADMKTILDIAQKYNLKLIEDACQSHGAEYHGKKAGSLGDMACFSFFPTKNITVAGDGGFITTSDEELAKKVKMLSNHGRWSSDEDAELFGHNYRMSEVLATIAREQLKKLDGFNERRRNIAKQYQELLHGVMIPIEKPDCKHVYHVYTIRCERRDELKEHLAKNEIMTTVMYAIPIHLQTAYAKAFGSKEGTCPNAEKFAKEILALPMHPALRTDEVSKVAETITKFYKGN